MKLLRACIIFLEIRYFDEDQEDVMQMQLYKGLKKIRKKNEIMVNANEEICFCF